MKAVNPIYFLRKASQTAFYLGLSVALYQNPVLAEVYKCTDADGNLSFSEIPCQVDSQSETIALADAPPEPPPFNPEDYCQVVFEEDYTLEDSSDKTSVRVKKGEKVLAGGFDGPDKLFCLTDKGVVSYRWDSFVDDKPPHHFTCISKVPNSNMFMTMGHSKLLVVFNDVNLYADEALTQFACRLSAGTTLGKGSSTGYFQSSPHVVNLSMDTLADICDGHTDVYFKTHKTAAGYAAPLGVPLWKLAKMPFPKLFW